MNVTLHSALRHTTASPVCGLFACHRAGKTRRIITTNRARGDASTATRDWLISPPISSAGKMAFLAKTGFSCHGSPNKAGIIAVEGRFAQMEVRSRRAMPAWAPHVRTLQAWHEGAWLGTNAQHLTLYYSFSRYSRTAAEIPVSRQQCHPPVY